MKEFDLLVLGGGSGGIAAANRAAEYGAKVAVIENNLLGGTCVNRGCVPKKAGWYAARLHEGIQHLAPGYGINTDFQSFDYPTFLKARDGYVSRSRMSYVTRFEKNGIELIEGKGKFIGEKILEVNGEQYSAPNIIIATGGRPAELSVKGSELLENSDDFFNWTTLPKSVAFIGAGYIAVELAQMTHAFGVETHLVIRHDRPLRKFDSMLSQSLMEEMEKTQLQVHTHTDFDEYRRNSEGMIECLIQNQVILTVEKVVCAVGRTANIEGIGLENTKVQINPKGKIQVSEGHETDQAGVYALGDVIDSMELTPVAIRSGRQVAEYLYNNAVTSAIDITNVPTVIFSHPAIGSIGFSEEDAMDKYGSENIKIYKSRFFSMYMSTAGVRQPCDFKLVCLGPEEKVIGLHGIGEGVDEMIQGFGVAMKMGATKQDFDAVIAIHPTGSEEFVTMR